MRRVELRAGQLVERRDDADVGGVGACRCRRVASASVADVVRCRRSAIARPAARRTAGRSAAPLGQQADLRVAEHRRRQHPVGQHRRRPRPPRPARRGADRRQRPSPTRGRRRAQRHLLRAQAERPGDRAGSGPDGDRPAPVSRPPSRAERRRQGGAGGDPLPKRRDLPGTLPRPGHRLGAPPGVPRRPLPRPTFAGPSAEPPTTPPPAPRSPRRSRPPASVVPGRAPPS